MVAGLLGRKADAFAALLDGTAKGSSDAQLARMGDLVQRLSAIPQPSAAFRSSLRDQLVSAATSPTLAPGPGGGSGGAPAHHDGTSAFQATPQHGAGTATPGSSSAGGLGSTGSTVAGGGGASSAGGAGVLGAGGIGGAGSAITTFAKTAPLWAKLFVVGTAVAVSGTGVGISAHRALPGDLFYGVKKQVEAVQLDLAGSAQEKALTQLGFAHARADEIQQLIKRNHVQPGQPMSADTAKEIRSALEDWAENAGEATTSLVKQIRDLGTSTANAALSTKLRQTLSEFTSEQFTQIGTTLASLPTGPVQSLTVSALGYLQRVDRVLGGNPEQLTQNLIKQLPVPLSAIPGVSDVGTILHLPVGGSTGTGSTTGGTLPVPLPTSRLSLPVPSVRGSAGAGGNTPKGGLPSVSVSLPLPNITPLPSQLPGNLPGRVVPSGIVPTGIINSLGGVLGGGKSSTGGTGSGGVGGTVGKTVDGVGSAVTGTGKTVTTTVKGVVGTVTGGLSSSAGPSLPLPTAVPTIPVLPSLPVLGGLGR